MVFARCQKEKRAPLVVGPQVYSTFDSDCGPTDEPSSRYIRFRCHILNVPRQV